MLTTAVSGVKCNIIDSYATTRSVRAPCTLENDVEICLLVDVSLSVAPRRTLVII